jgi:phosphodiesterase/alkaline phosphatase D-like protein
VPRFHLRHLVSFSVLAWWIVVSGLRAQTASPFVSGAWCGNVTPTSATVCVRLNAAGLRVRLVVSPNDRLSPAVFSPVDTTAAASGNIASLDVEGLQPATEYFYGVEVGGVLRTETISRGRFRTFPQGAASFRLAFASCGDTRDPDQRAYDAIAAEQPLLFVMTGDLHYGDTNTGVAEDYRRNYDIVLNHPNQGGLYRSVPTAYMWDDHDFTGDDTNGTAAGTAAARAVYRDYVPHYPINVTGGTVAQAFTVGRVRVIMTDLRSASSAPTAAETGSKTRMGTAQKAWFKQEMLGARDAGFPLILWVNTSPWIGPPQLGNDTWGGYVTERTELADFFKENRIRNVVILSGDMHSLAYDDGTNSDFAIGGGAPLVVLHAAALTRPGEAKDGHYAAGPILGSAQYGLLEVTDTGGPSVQCLFTGKRVGEGAKLVFQFVAGTAGVVPTGVSGPVSTVDRALVNISTRGRITSASDTLIVGFVIGGSSSRTLLLRAVGPTLASFDVSDPLPRPQITLYRGSTVIAINNDWNVVDSERLINAFDRVGAFRLGAGSTPDAALVVTLAPGAYTMQATGLGGTTGSVLLEAYEVP